MFSSVARSATPIDSNTSPDAEQLEGVAAQAVGADHPDLGETAGAGIADKHATTRPIFERDSTRDTVILVMLKHMKTRLGRETAVQSGALIEDRMAVALFVGADAGVGGYGAGVGQDDLQEKGMKCGRYERSEGASRSSRASRQESRIFWE